MVGGFYDRVNQDTDNGYKNIYGFTCYNFSGGYRMVEAARLCRCAAPEAFPCGQEKAQKV